MISGRCREGQGLSTFPPAAFTPVAFQAWTAAPGNRSQESLTSWYYLRLEERSRPAFIIPPVVQSSRWRHVLVVSQRPNRPGDAGNDALSVETHEHRVRSMRKRPAATSLALVAGAAWVVTGALRRAATIEAEVKYNGPAQVEKLKINKDVEKCGNEATVEKVVVGGNKGLAHAVVSVPEAKGAATAKKISVDQHGCKFVPHVVVMQPGELEIKNSDDILHNIHTYSTANPSINKAQPKFKDYDEKLDSRSSSSPCSSTSDARWVSVCPPGRRPRQDGVTKTRTWPAGKQRARCARDARQAGEEVDVSRSDHSASSEGQVGEPATGNGRSNA